MIVIIGESHSLYHTSLYGYEKQTYPLMEERERNGELFVFKNAVTTNDVTALVMNSVFSLDSMGVDFNEYPLFPAVFKAAGFKTALYDNEYLADESLYLMTNSTLSNLMYDQRNTNYYDYDGDMIRDISYFKDSLALYVLHLAGHHVRYDKRYPQSFAKFKTSDYGGSFSESQKEIIAAYDNASLYNDYIVNEVIKKFEDDNAVVVYFSDHGEEVFEVRDYRGHGTAKYTSDIRYQLRVPLWVWLSDKYKEEHPFVPVDVTEEAKGYAPWVNEHIWELNRMQKEKDEVCAEPGPQCTDPYECWYYGYCHGKEEPAAEQMAMEGI